jgi:hypothetical protein
MTIVAAVIFDLSASPPRWARIEPASPRHTSELRDCQGA